MATTATARLVAADRLPAELLKTGRKAVAEPSSDNKKVFAELLVQLREQHTDRDGRTDYGGSSQQLRDEMQALYRKLGIDDETEHKAIRTGIRYHVQKIVRARLLAQVGGDEVKYGELCVYYGLKPQHADETRKARAAAERIKARGLVTVDDAVTLVADTRAKVERFLKTNSLEALDPAMAAKLRDEAAGILELLAPVVAALDSAPKAAGFAPAQTSPRRKKK